MDASILLSPGGISPWRTRGPKAQLVPKASQLCHRELVPWNWSGQHVPTGLGQGGEGRTGGEGVLLPPRRQHSPWMPLTVRYCYHLTALGKTIFVIQPCLSQPAARPSVGFHGKLPSKTRRKGVTAGVTQPQLEASADEAEKGGNLPTGSVPIGQRDLGTPPDTSCSSLVCPNPSTLQVGARPKGDALCKRPRNASPFRSTLSPADCIRPCSPLAVGEEE